MKTLLLMRHARSAGMAPHRPDLERPLTERGRKDVPIMARRISGRALRPDLIASSPALRALTTARLVAQELSLNGQAICVDAALYESTLEGYLEFLTTLPEAAQIVLVVGHNPTISACVNLLASSSVPELPAGGVAGVIAEIASWSDLRRRCGRLLFVDDPERSME
jgi:phosphohistidine phosphatase